MSGFRLPPAGPFSLAASTRFLEGFAPAAWETPGESGHLHLAFPVEGDWRSVGVCLRQPDGDVVGEVYGDGLGEGLHEVEQVRAQTARILSLDVDGSGFRDVGKRDPVVGGLQQRYPGLRPVCFWSPYEAAAWAVISHRTRITQAAAVKRRIAEDLGTTVDIHGDGVVAFPGPDQLGVLEQAQGLDERKVTRLHAVAEAALEGRLDGARLRGMDSDEALARLQELPGIGPFFAELILLRGAGEPDRFPSGERRLHQSMAELYRRDKPDLATLTGIADGWRPYRTWVSVLIRTWREEETQEISGNGAEG